MCSARRWHPEDHAGMPAVELCQIGADLSQQITRAIGLADIASPYSASLINR